MEGLTSDENLGCMLMQTMLFEGDSCGFAGQKLLC